MSSSLGGNFYIYTDALEILVQAEKPEPPVTFALGCLVVSAILVRLTRVLTGPHTT